MEIHERDLFLQKKAYVSTVAGFTGERDDTNEAKNSRDLVTQLHTIEEDARAYRIVKNGVISAIFWLILFGLATFVAHTCTSIDFLALPPSHLTRIFRKLVKKVGGKFTEDSFQRRSYTSCRMQRAALIAAIFSCIIYFAVVLGTFFVIFRLYRNHNQWKWDYTIFNSDYDTTITIIQLIIPAIVIMMLGHIVCVGLLSIPFVKRSAVRLFGYQDEDLKKSNTTPNILMNRSESPVIEDKTCTALSLLTWQWLLYLSVIIGNTFLASQAYQCVYLPIFMSVQFTTYYSWTARFQSLCLSFVVTALIAYTTVIHIIYVQYIHSGQQKLDPSSKSKSNNDLVTLPPALLKSPNGGKSLRQSGRNVLTSSAALRMDPRRIMSPIPEQK
ncbi:hypothetical protein PROFUN_01723 [Planoprotostelium fungivorum]|uniref:Uncharacterized protein n=1 Tax=Planoprotostelium fungivorum TaxID=1890364 RepID=A0A2P6MWD9_9EUKA|nr:hypothetical protein PROFUN_01723 [Planoprotostelium fungivorum]